MKLLLLSCLVAGLLLTGCDKADPEPEGHMVVCYGPIPVKSVKDTEGTVRYSSETKEYIIIVTRPGTTGSTDVGILYNTLPKEVQVHDLKVIFSGTYYEKPGTPTGGTVTEYYLHVDNIVAK